MKPTAAPGPERLARVQLEFAAHVRDPEAHPVPAGTDDRRMAVYRRLFFNNISSLLAGNFPVLRGLCDDERWHALIRDFYSEYRCRTPLFTEVAREFLRYLQDHRGERSDDPAFLLELAHYEWVELALAIDERDLADVPAEPDGDLMGGRPVISPLAWALSYRFPVHRIRREYQPAQPPREATHLLVYRNRRDDVKFMQLNDVTRLLLQQLGEAAELSGTEHLRRVAAAIRHPDPERVIAAGADILAELRRRDVVLGTHPRPRNPSGAR